MGMYKFAAIALLPMLLTSTFSEPLATAVSLGLAYVLIQMTIDEAKPSAAFDSAKEDAAVKDVRITGTGNRLVRLAFGSTHLYCAAKFAAASAGGAMIPSSWPLAGVLGHLVSWVGVASLSFWGVVWILSGSYGQ